ncbi:hypothetical protein VNO78_21056 [Psophocarpus tetragonolobus]|uniref:Protein BIC1 n=1 Tax=Psophocarpus tetragonolobus TaxID=3891 RepID=A0AAN9SAX8_PSOTE
MAHLPSSPAESDHHITPPPSKLRKPHQPKGNKIGQQHHDNSHSDRSQYNTLGQTPSASKVHSKVDSANEISGEGEDSGRERLKRHRVEVAGRVWIPEIWGQEELLKDWIDCTAFDAPLVPSRIVMARRALVEEGRRATSGGLRIENRC